jgi:hypothetical protein
MVFFFFFFFPIKVLLAFGLCTGASSYFLNFKKLQEIPKKKKKKKKEDSVQFKKKKPHYSVLLFANLILNCYKI